MKLWIYLGKKLTKMSKKINQKRLWLVDPCMEL